MGPESRRLILKTIQTNSGFLENVRLDFSPTLTCIIGARGTCKSTLVESLRFAFDADTDRVRELTTSDGLITRTLGAGSVRCVVDVSVDSATHTYEIERELGSDPRITRNGERDPLVNDLRHDIEIYSQGSLEKLASSQQPQLRLQLIDRPHQSEIASLQNDIRQCAAELGQTGIALRQLGSDIEKRRVLTKDIDKIRAELENTLKDRPEVPPTLEEQHAQYLARQRVLELFQELEQTQQNMIVSLDESLTEATTIGSISERAKDLPDADSTIGPFLSELNKQIAAVQSNRKGIANVNVARGAAEAAARFEAQNKEYYEQRQQRQAITESLKREDILRRQLSDLEKSERELRDFVKKREMLLERRQKARLNVEALRDRIFELRVLETEHINRQFGDVILLSIRRAALSQPYIAKLTELMSGSRIRGQDDIARELATTLTPADLLTIIEQGDAQRLAALLDRDLGQITRVVTYLRDHPDLYSLEGNLADDALDITMFDQGVPKAVEELSAGQRATALLPLILRDSTCPLVIDQPEDDLDNSFIYKVLVQNVLRLKGARQLIFVTHNANIPVLGDADKIVVMHMDAPDKAGKPRTGSLDERKADILDLLEGGEEAFANRDRRYHEARP